MLDFLNNIHGLKADYGVVNRTTSLEGLPSVLAFLVPKSKFD